jgi:hypothetical protein
MQPDLKALGIVCRRRGIIPTRFVLVVNIARQQLQLLGRVPPGYRPRCGDGIVVDRQNRYVLLKVIRCSTSKFGIGELEGSNKTPRGLHQITDKIGGGWPVGTVFKSRQVIGFTWQGMPLAPITNRILWLGGLEPGLNRGGNVDSHGRFIYIHGTGDEPGIGRPASHGCIQLPGDDLIPLYDMIPRGSLVWIVEGLRS